MTMRRALVPLLGLLALVATACPVSTPGGGGTTTTTIDPGPPVAVAGASPSIGDAPLTVTFDSSGSTAGSGTGLTFAWDFGDGSPVDNSIAPTHIYNTPGSYNAKLTLTNSAGTSTSPNIPIQVNVDPNPKYYVRTTGGTGSTCGPLANPCSTITQAVTNASANGIHAIRVAGGSFTGTVNVPSNLEIVGGYKQNFTDTDPAEVTTIFGTATFNSASRAHSRGLRYRASTWPWAST